MSQGIARDHAHGNEAIPATLTLENLTVSGDVAVGDDLTADDVTVTDLVQAARVTVTGTDGLRYKHIGAKVTDTANNVSLTTATLTVLTFDTESYDTSAFHSTSSTTGRLTAPYTGRYLVTAECVFSAEATPIDSQRLLQIRLNANGSGAGGTLIAQNNGALPALAQALTLQATVVVALTATDYVEVFAFQNSGETLNAEDRWAAIVYLGDA